MIWTLIEIVAILVENIIIIEFLISYFGFRSEKYKIRKAFVILAIFSVIDTVGTFTEISEPIIIITFVVTEIICCFILFNGNHGEKIVIPMISYVLILLVNLPVLTISSFLSKISPDVIADSTSHSITRVIGIFITKLLYFAFTRIILITRKKEKLSFKLNEWIIIISAFSITLIIEFMMNAIILNNSLNKYVYILISFLLSSLDVIIFVFMKKMSTANQKETERIILKNQLTMHENDIQQLEHQYAELSMLRHDYKNQLNCILSLICEKKYDNAEKYIREFIGNSKISGKQHINSSSMVLNAVINEKISCAEQKNIEVSCRILLPIPEYLEYDMSIILSNLMDNAIEACDNNIQSNITLVISDIAGYYRIVVKNTIEESVLDSNSNLESIKDDKKKHGWGLKSVHEITDKHSGIIDIYEKNKMFIVSILLAKQEKK